jgi:hypothetical protein
MDQTLDIIVNADLRHWRWKDEEELEEAVGLSVYTRQEAQEIRAAGERALASFLPRKPPFDRAWEKWRPDRNWVIPQLSGDWEAVEQT